MSGHTERFNSVGFDEEVKRKKAYYDAEYARVRYEKEAGVLVNKKNINKFYEGIIETLKNSLYSIPPDMLLRILECKTTHEITGVINEHYYHCFEYVYNQNIEDHDFGKESWANDGSEEDEYGEEENKEDEVLPDLRSI